MADGGTVSVADVEVWIDSRLEWRDLVGRRRAGGRGLSGTDGAGEGEINSGGRAITSEGDRSHVVGARVDAELILVGAAIGVTSVKLDVFGRGLEVAEIEGLDGRGRAGFAACLSDDISSVEADTGAGLDFATEGCEAPGRVIGSFAERPQSASLPEWPAAGDNHPPVLSLGGESQPPPSARGEPQPSSFPPTGERRLPLFWDGDPHPTTGLLAVKVDCTPLVACD